MKRWFGAMVDWFEFRLGLREALGPMLTHPVPRGLGWWYVFGSATLTLFLMQIVSGICLSMVYVPSADRAYESLEYLNYEQPVGWILRAIHFYAGSGMVVMLAIHVSQVFLMSGFKYPRELTWLLGVVLLALTLGFMFSGQILRWDVDAYWGLGVGASMAGRVPLLGPAVVRLLLGGPTIGGDSLSRFFALHVFVFPGLLIGLLAVHLYLVLRQGISAPPKPGEVVNPATYQEEYHRALAEGEPFHADALWRDAIFSSVVAVVVVALAVVCGPMGPKEEPDPVLLSANPRPDWPFLPLFGLLSLSPPEFETVLMLGLPVIGLVFLALIPFVAGKGERHLSRRPVAVLGLVLFFVLVGVFWYLGATAPWSPAMTAWSGTPVPEDLIKGRSPLQLQGAAVFQNKSCRNCHCLERQGGRRGPDLTQVATRLNREQLTTQVINGSPNMPAYGKQLNPAEVEALVAFLKTLHAKGQEPARDFVTSAR